MKYTLADGSEIEAFSSDEMKAEIERETSGLKTKVDELLGEKKNVSAKARELEQTMQRTKEEEQKNRGEYEALYEKTLAELNAEREKSNNHAAALQRREIELATSTLASSLTRDVGRAEVLAEKFAQHSRYTEKGVVFEIDGIESPPEKLADILKSKYPFLIDGSGATGGGAAGGTINGGAGSKGNMGGNRDERVAAIATKYALPR